MARKKPADLAPSLVAVKGKAAPAVDAPSRAPETPATPSTASAPLNFKVDAEFRRRFRRCAAEADLKLNELLREALDAWEERRGLRG